MYCTNPNYIHEFDMLIEYADVLESADNSVNLAMSNLIKTERKVKYSAMFENADNMYMIEEAQKNLFEKIGDAIKSLLSKVADMFKSLFKGKKEDEFKNNVAAAQQAVANDPSLKDQLITGIKDGKYDIKDISAYTKAYEEASKLLAEGKIDPNTFKGKMELALKKFDEKPKTTVRLNNLNAAILACSGGLLLKTISDNRKYHGQVSSAVDRAHNRFHKMLATKDENGEYNTALAAFWEATRAFINANANEANKNNTIINTLNNVFKKFSKKTDSDRASKAKKHLERSHRGDEQWYSIQDMKSAAKNYKKNLDEFKEKEKQYKEGKINLTPEELKKLRSDIISSETQYNAAILEIIDKDPDLTETERLKRKTAIEIDANNSYFNQREANIEKEKEKLNKEKEKIEKEKEKLNKEKKEVTTKLNCINKQIKFLKDERSQLKSWINKRHTLSELYDEKNRIERLIQNTNNTIAGLNRSIPILKDKCDQAKQQSPQNPEIKTMEDEIGRLEASLQVAQEEIKSLHDYHIQLIDKIKLAKKHNNRA